MNLVVCANNVDNAHVSRLNYVQMKNYILNFVNSFVFQNPMTNTYAWNSIISVLTLTHSYNELKFILFNILFVCWSHDAIGTASNKIFGGFLLGTRIESCSTESINFHEACLVICDSNAIIIGAIDSDMAQ